jgi:hypothetical protein
MKTGHFAYLIASIFLNLSYTMGVMRKLSLPRKDFATSLMEVYGDIRSKVNE